MLRLSVGATALFALVACAARRPATSELGTPAPDSSSGSGASHVNKSYAEQLKRGYELLEKMGYK